MSRKPKNRHQEQSWEEAKRTCRLSDEGVGMAKDLGFQPQTLISNIPNRSQPWNLPVKEWVRSLHEEKFPDGQLPFSANNPRLPSTPM